MRLNEIIINPIRPSLNYVFKWPRPNFHGQVMHVVIESVRAVRSLSGGVPGEPIYCVHVYYVALRFFQNLGKNER